MNQSVDMEIVQAIYDFDALEEGSLSFKRGDLLQVLNKLPSGWWDGILIENQDSQIVYLLRGWFPSNYIKEYNGIENHELLLSTFQRSDRQDAENDQDQKYDYNQQENDALHETIQQDNTDNTKQNQNQNHSHLHIDDTVVQEEDDINGNHTLDSRSSHQLPENWGIKTSPDGRPYYFNVVTNETRWSLNLSNLNFNNNRNRHLSFMNHDIVDKDMPNSAKLLDNLLQEIKEYDAEIMEQEDHEVNKLTELDDGTRLVFSWTGLSRNITSKLALLFQNIREKAKDSYPTSVAATVMAINILFHSSGMSSKSSPILSRSSLLSSIYSKMLSLTANLILQSNILSQTWPPPSAEEDLQNTVSSLLITVRELTAEATRLQLPIKVLSEEELFPVSREKFDEIGNEVASSQEDDGPAFLVDPTLLIKLEEKMVDISTMVASCSINHEASVGEEDEEDPIILASSPLNRNDLVKSIQKLVKLVGEYLLIIDEFPFLEHGQVNEGGEIPDDSDTVNLVTAFKTTRANLLNGISDLVKHTRRFVKEKISPEAKHDTLVSVERVVEVSKKLLVSTKFLVEKKEQVDQSKLKEIISSKNSHHSLESSPTVTSSIDVKMPLFDRHKSAKLECLKYDSMGPFSPSHDTYFSPKHMSISSQTMNEYKDAWFLMHPDYDQDQVLIDTETGEWKAALLPAYICKLTSHLETDDLFTAVFLASYRTVTTTATFVPLLLERFSLATPEGLQETEKIIWVEKKLKPIRFRVFLVLKLWLENYIQDDRDDRAVLNIIEGFAESIMKEHMSASAAKIIQLVESKVHGGIKPITSSMIGIFGDIPPSIIPKSWAKMKLMDFDPLEVARQITILETSLFQTISATELISTVWTTHATKNVSKMIVHSKTFTAWVSYIILQSGADPKKRSKMISFFISLAQELIQLRNFNAFSCILLALESKPIKRLEVSWGLVSSKQMALFKSLIRGGNSKRFIEYRSNEKSSQVPCMPLFPVLLNDFEGIKKNYATFVKDSLYNYEKLSKVADLVKDFKTLPTTFQLHTVPKIKKYLEEELTRYAYTDDELIQLSMHVEPEQRVFVPVSIVATAGFVYEYQTNPAAKRTITLWKELGPIITHYRFIEAKLKYSPSWIIDERDNPYERLHVAYSSQVMETLRDLRGFYIKVAQVMANRSDVLPEIYIEKLRVLEDGVPPLLTGPEAREFIRKSLGLERLDDEFVGFRDEPIGSASIGQVHQATLKRNGKKVAIKLQGPGSEELFRMDIGAAKNFCRVFAPEQVLIFDEIEAQFLTEFDYRKEANNLKIVGENMRKAGFTGIVVPEPFLDLCTKDVLTMEFLKGPKLIDGAREKGRQYAASIGKTFQELENEWKENINRNGMPRPYHGPNAFQLELYKKAVLIKDGIMNAPICILNTTISLYNYLFNQKRQYFTYYESFIPLNSSFIMDTLLKAHGHQLLINGFFNADPHPGNFLLTPDGKIAMIDYGQVKQLNGEQRLLIARMVLAFLNKDENAILQIYKETGYKSKYMNPNVMCKILVVVLDRDGSDVTEGLNLQQFVDKMYAIDPWENTADFMVMPIRMSLLMRGIGLMLNHPVSVCTAWRSLAERVLYEHNFSYVPNQLNL